MPEYIIHLICVRDFNASNCTSAATIREANVYIVYMSIFNNLAALLSIGAMIYCAENLGRKPVYAVICFGVAADNLGLGLAHTPLFLSIIHSLSGLLVSIMYDQHAAINND